MTPSEIVAPARRGRKLGKLWCRAAETALDAPEADVAPEPLPEERSSALAPSGELQDHGGTICVPADWRPGALLNVRIGDDYCVTLYPEEYDYQRPERAIRFTNGAVCQNFVSSWICRQHFDPRAF